MGQLVPVNTVLEYGQPVERALWLAKKGDLVRHAVPNLKPLLVQMAWIPINIGTMELQAVNLPIKCQEAPSHLKQPRIDPGTSRQPAGPLSHRPASLPLANMEPILQAYKPLSYQEQEEKERSPSCVRFGCSGNTLAVTFNC
jgi:hypothetical protein